MIEKETVWQVLKSANQPIVLYGMGDGADKILDICSQKKIVVSDVFASDEYVRGHSFRGFEVKKISEIEKFYDNPIIVLAFAAFRDDLLQKIYSLGEKYLVLAPDVPLFGTGILSLETLKINEQAINRAYNSLCDEKSKFVFSSIINYKMSGKIEYLKNCQTERSEVFDNIIKLQDDEIYADLGAYNGDTLQEFLDITKNSFSKAVCFEPDRKNFKKLMKNIEQTNDARIIGEQKAAWCGKTTLTFFGEGGRNSAICECGYTVDADSIDNYFKGQRVSYIKMDVEGVEEQAIEGCEKTIKMWHPSMAISCYHKCNDFFVLINKILDITTEYNVFLRHHPYIPAWETNIYCVPKNKAFHL